MTKQNEEPLRGDAAWRAAKARVAEHNEAAYKRGREQRAAQDQMAADKRRAADKAESERLPRQPDLD